VTLAITIVSHHGIWQSADTRLYDVLAKRPLTDASVKQWIFMTADGIATVAYAGLGRLDHDLHVSDLMVRLLRGEERNLRDTLLAVKGFANERLGPIAWHHRMPHSFNVGAFVSASTYAAEISNQQVIKFGYPKNVTRLQQSFEIQPVTVGKSGRVLFAGMRSRVKASDAANLAMAADACPRSYRDYMKLLAAITERVARRVPDYVSGQCHVVYIRRPPLPDSVPPSETEAFGWAQPPSMTVGPSVLLHGIDITSMMNPILLQLEAGKHPHEVSFEIADAGIALEPGVPVVDVTSGRIGRVESDPYPGGAVNDAGVRWDDAPGEVVVARKNTFVVLYPGHPRLRNRS
jgi:hypothetical protein